MNLRSAPDTIGLARSAPSWSRPLPHSTSSSTSPSAGN